jgi:hypothetical protein
MATISFKAQVLSEISKLDRTIQSPDTTNKGALLARAFMWDEIASFAKKQSDSAWKELEDAGFIGHPDEQGTHVIATTPKFSCVVQVSNPVKRFSADELQKIMKRSKFKVPEPVMREYIDQAKVGTKPAIKYTISERS